MTENDRFLVPSTDPEQSPVEYVFTTGVSFAVPAVSRSLLGELAVVRSSVDVPDEWLVWLKHRDWSESVTRVELQVAPPWGTVYSTLIASTDPPGPLVTAVLLSTERSFVLFVMSADETATTDSPIAAIATIAMTEPTERRLRALAPTTPLLNHARISNLSLFWYPRRRRTLIGITPPPGRCRDHIER
jgi:hypothetical protein